MSTRSLTARFNAVLQGTLVNTLADGSDVAGFPFTAQINDSITNGNSGALTGNREWESKGRILGSGSSETFDLSSFSGFDIGAGSGNDPVGQSAGFNSVTILWAFNYPTSAGTLILGNDGSGAEWTSIRGAAGVVTEIPPQGYYILNFDGVTALAVAPGSNAKLKIAASGGACSYDIYICGRY